jgi:hypothetical protein
VDAESAATLNATTVSEGGNHRWGFTDALEAWHSHVVRLTAELNSPTDTRGLWVPHDLLASLIFRNALERGLSQVPQDLLHAASAALDVVDSAYIEYTEPDDCGCAGRVDTDVPSGEGWWWQRVPKRGLIRLELERYYGHPVREGS